MTPLGSTRLMKPRSCGVMRSSDMRRDSTDCQMTFVVSGVSDIAAHPLCYVSTGLSTGGKPHRAPETAGIHLSSPQGVVTNPRYSHVDNATGSPQSLTAQV